MTVLAPGFEAPVAVPIGSWMPSRYTATLTGTEDFDTDGDRLLELIDRIGWRAADGAKPDVAQRWLIRHLLEKYPADWHVVELRGQLRFRQAVVSMARQNGKSVIAAVLALYFIAFHVRGPRVVGLASVESQAKIVYDRVKFAIDHCPDLVAGLRTTETRGIHRRDGSGVYKTMPSKVDTAQGEPITGCIYDELHIGLSALWDAIIEGQKAKTNSLMVGLTTAGDSSSLLLKRLYRDGDRAIEGNDERFFFAVWESVTAEFGPDYVPTEEDIIAASPAIALGRVALGPALDAARKLWVEPADEDGVTGREKVIRFTMNRFLDGAAGAWVGADTFRNAIGPAGPVLMNARDPVYSIQRTGEWEHASITATVKHEGRLYTQLVASLDQPDHDLLLDVAAALAKRGPATFVVPSSTLQKTGLALKEAGHTTWVLGATEEADAASRAHAAVTRGNLVRADDKLVTYQSARAKRRTLTEGAWRISKTLSTSDVDAIEATINGVFVAETAVETGMQLF